MGSVYSDLSSLYKVLTRASSHLPEKDKSRAISSRRLDRRGAFLPTAVRQLFLVHLFHKALSPSLGNRSLLAASLLSRILLSLQPQTLPLPHLNFSDQLSDATMGEPTRLDVIGVRRTSLTVLPTRLQIQTTPAAPALACRTSCSR